MPALSGRLEDLVDDHGVWVFLLPQLCNSTLRGNVPDDLVFHADRGAQFTSDQLYQMCRELGIDQSMGRTGVCFENAMTESFWSTLKTSVLRPPQMEDPG